jgi:hypothetical protein
VFSRREQYEECLVKLEQQAAAAAAEAEQQEIPADIVGEFRVTTVS